MDTFHVLCAFTRMLSLDWIEDWIEKLGRAVYMEVMRIGISNDPFP